MQKLGADGNQKKSPWDMNQWSKLIFLGSVFISLLFSSLPHVEVCVGLRILFYFI